MSAHIESILDACLLKNGWFRTIEIMESTSIQRNTVSRYLNALADMGWLSVEGKTQTRQYRLTAQPRPSTKDVVKAARCARRGHRRKRSIKLSTEDVVEICWRRWVKGESFNAIARRFGVGAMTVHALLKGRTHRDTVDVVRDMHQRGRLAAVEYFDDTVEYAKVRR